MSKTITNNLLEKIKSFEWLWHIEGDIRRYDYWNEKLQAIGELIKAKKLIRRIGYDLILGEDIDLLRIECFLEFDSKGTGFEMFYEDSHTGAKWYAREN